MTKPAPSRFPAESSVAPVTVRLRHAGKKAIILLICASLLGSIVGILLFVMRKAVFIHYGGRWDDALHNGVQPTQADLWTAPGILYKILCEGPVPFFIAGVFFVGVFYALFLAGFRMIPTYAGDARGLRRVLQYLDRESNQLLPGLHPVIGAAEGSLRLTDRLRAIEILRATGNSRSELHQANDRLGASEETQVAASLMPLDWVEWMLPVLGFIGTVIGVTGAIAGLKQVALVVIASGGVVPEIRKPLDECFEQLVLAFDTTFLGLMGIAFIASATFLFRKLAVNTLSATHQVVAAAIDRIEVESSESEHWLEWIGQALLELDESGKPVFNNGKPSFRAGLKLEQLEELIRTGQYETDAQGNLARVDGKPHWRIEGLLRSWLEQFTRGLFVVDANGKLVISKGTNAPIPRDVAAIQHLHSSLIRSLYEVTEEEAERIADGILEGGEEVMLRSSFERRHVELRRLLLFLISRLRDANPNSETGEAGAMVDLGKVILEPNLSPVEAMNSGPQDTLLVAREAGSGFGTYLIEVLQRNELELGTGGYLPQRQVAAGSACPRAVGANEEWLAFGCPGRTLHVSPRAAGGNLLREVGRDHAKHLVPGALGLFNGRLVWIEELGGRMHLMAVPLTGSDALRTVSLVVDLGPSGTHLAFASSDGRLACAGGPGQDPWLWVWGEGAEVPASWSSEKSIQALAIDAAGNVWAGDGAGAIFKIDFESNRMVDQGNMGRAPKWIAVTEAGQVVGANESGLALLVMTPGQSEINRQRTFGCPIRAVCAAKNGMTVFVGLENGAVYALASGGLL